MHYFLKNEDHTAARQLIFIGEQNNVCHQLEPAEQKVYTQLFDKYEGKEGFTSVSVSETLFSLIASAAPVDEKEVKDMIDDIKGIRVLVYDADSMKSIQYYKEISGSISKNDYKELMTVNSEGDNVVFLGKMSSEKVVDELLLLCNSGSEFVMVSIVGKIDMDKISKLSDMSIEGLDKLKKADDAKKSDN